MHIMNGKFRLQNSFVLMQMNSLLLRLDMPICEIKTIFALKYYMKIDV